MPSMGKLEIKNLCFSYDETHPVIDDVSLSIEKGSFVVVLGHNGSGKSTLAKLIVGLLEKNSGQIFLDGEEIDKKNLRKLQTKTALVFQNPDNQFIGSTVEDDIAFGLENLCVPQEEMDPIIDKTLSTLNMSSFKERNVSNLSGGERQKIAIAGILAMNLDYIIFDEATSMLDPIGRRDLINLIKELNREGKTIIMITHDMSEALLSDRCIVLSQGKIIKDDTPINVLNDEACIKEANLEETRSLYLYNRLKEKGYSRKEVLDVLWQLNLKA